MRRMMKFLSFILIVCAMLVTTNVNAVDKTITFTSSSRIEPYNQIIMTGAGTTYKTATLNSGDVVIAYCFNKQKEAPPVGSTLTYRELTQVEKANASKFIYILQNGYGGKWKYSDSGITDKQEKYYVTQLAIWGLQGQLKTGVDFDLNGLVAETDTEKRIKKYALQLLADANKYSPTVPSISIKGDYTDMKITDDKRFYRTSDYSVGGHGFETYKVTLANVPIGTEIIVSGSDVTKHSGDTLNAGQKFYVRIPVEKLGNSVINPKIIVTATGKSESLAIYKPGNAVFQDVGIAYKSSVSLKAETSAHVEAKGSLQIEKVSVNASGNIEKLNNVKITVKNSAGAVVGSWTTDSTNNPYTINNLPVGAYTIIEENAPEGYIKSENIQVGVKAAQTIKVKLENYKDVKVKISKQDITTGTELEGAHLILKSSLGDVVDEWDSKTTPHYITKKLTPGMTYILTETSAPEGYQSTTETVSFVVNADGGVDKEVIMYNKPISPVKISKQEITTGKELPGATLVIKDSKGNIVDEWVSTTTPHYIDNLPEGKYTLIETIPPEGYGISEEIIEFEVNSNGVEQTVVMTNEKIPKTADMNVTLIVVGLVGTVLLAGFSMFKINKQEA